MARQLAVAIGVARVDGLTPLQGVHPGVANFADWAAGQGFGVVVHEDATSPVTAGDVYKTVQAAVDAGDVERLFVFFSGHGMERGVGDDLWLLSDAAQDPGAAVNVAKSAALARHCGIPHVAFFADACRTPATAAFNALTGRPIFPQTRIPQVRVAVDQFYATISGDPAYEPRSSGEATFGIFTDCLMAALRGHEPDALEEVDGGRASYAVLASSLEEYLWERVRDRSSRTVRITQTPDCIPVSDWEPHVLSWVHRHRSEEGTDSYTVARPRAAVGPLPALRGPRRDADRNALVDAVAAGIAAQPGRTHFETRIGASVVGAPVLGAVTGVGPIDRPFEEDGATHVRGYGDERRSLLLEVGFEAGPAWVATVLLPGHVTTVSAGATGAEHVAFVAIGHDEEIERDRLAIARAAAAARTGRRDFADSDEGQRLLAAGNPTMAVLAAYAYDRSGRRADVEDVALRCHAATGLVPYDVALLAGVLGDFPVFPWYPLMARGWALAESLPAGEEWFEYGRARLAPAQWTTFRELDDEALRAFSETRG